MSKFFLCVCLVFIACDTGGDWEDDHQLNPDLIGTWIISDPYPDTYTITSTTVSHPEAFSGPYTNAEIVYIYNFNSSKTSGGLIIKRTETEFQGSPFLAVWFKDLKPQDKVLLGDAYDTTKNYEIESTDASVATLEEAKQKFTPAKAAIYGGGSAQGGTPQEWKTSP